MTRRHIARLAVVLALVLPAAAQAQSRTFYDADGKVIGRSITGTNGAITFYGANGRIKGRATTGSDGAVTFYDASGRRVGTTTKPQGK